LARIDIVVYRGVTGLEGGNFQTRSKIIRYNHLVANLVVFHNVVSMTRALQEFIAEGYPVTPELIARLSPYKTEHINRFGHYELRFDRVPPPVTEDLQLSPALAVR
jgi:Tn3 transposase DDE domain